jgi:hypothetical protein
MERRVLKLGGRSYGDSMEGAYGRSWKVWKEWMEFRAKIQLFSDTAKFGGVIRKCLKCAFRLKVVKLPYS